MLVPKVSVLVGELTVDCSDNILLVLSHISVSEFKIL